MKILVSACLLGLCCRYDGKSVPNEQITALLDKHTLIPVCPEILGGLPTPRLPSEIIGQSASEISDTNPKGLKLINNANEDMTAAFARGAKEALKLAKLYGCNTAILKSHSPSCGHGEIYDGTFSGTLTKGNGLTAELLIHNDIKVYDEHHLEELLIDK